MKTISLADLHAVYQREHPKMDRRDKNNISKTFSIIEDIMPGLSVNTFGKMQFWHFRNELILRDYSRTYCNKLMSKVKAVFRWGATYDLCAISVYENLRLVELVKFGEAREDIPREDVADQVIQRTLEYLPSMVRDMVIFQRATGMRPSEVCRMKAGDIHQINHNGNTFWVCELKVHKTARFGKTRVIPLNKQALDIVMHHTTDKPPDHYVFVTEDKHAAWTVHHWDKVIAAVIQKHKLLKWTLYQLRHTKGTELSIQEGVEVAADVLGNSVSVMSKIYDHGKTARLFRSLSVQNSLPIPSAPRATD